MNLSPYHLLALGALVLGLELDDMVDAYQGGSVELSCYCPPTNEEGPEATASDPSSTLQDLHVPDATTPR